VRKTLPLLGLLAALIVPPTAPAAEIGLNIAGGAAATDADVKQIADTGAKWARHFLFYDDIDANGMAAFRRGVIDTEQRLGMKTLIVVAGTDHRAPNPDVYARKMGEMATMFKCATMAYEIWNEADEALWWNPAPDPAAYTALLKKSYAAIKAADPSATVIATPTTGANYAWVDSLYKAGAKGSFDAMAVHTDTACLIDSPYHFYRDNGRIARFTFLGVREVKATMQAHGDDKPIWITELGWAARANEKCDSGAWAGQKAAGVTEAQQAEFMLQAFHCLNVDPAFGVTVAMWFTHKDPHYGLYRMDGSARPALAAFRSMGGNTSNDKLQGPCGDFGGPEVRILEPTAGATIGPDDPLRIRATSSDSDVLRMTFSVMRNGTRDEIRNYTNDGKPLDFSNAPDLTWQGVKDLPPGKYTLVVTALDLQQNEGKAETEFQIVNPTALAPVRVKFGSFKLRGKGRNRVLRGRVLGAYGINPSGKVKVEWQNRRKGKWKKIHSGLKNANKPFTFRQKLRYRGQWRVRVTYLGKAPFVKTVGKWKRFRA
jgi:hypothetical protein